MKKYMDCHVHMLGKISRLEDMLEGLDAADVDAAVVLSFPPESNAEADTSKYSFAAEDRLSFVMEWAGKSERIFPFFWIDPMEEDAFKQVDMAVEAGIAGFKVICNHFYPCDERPMEVWRHIAGKKKPILFHSGILYTKNFGSVYNRPVNFEPLFEIPDLKFALAHVSWPWHDECIALYGHWRWRYESHMTTAEMFIDTTPGTPKIYREEVLTKLYRAGAGIEDNIMQGTDCFMDYDAAYSKDIHGMDEFLLDKLGVTEEQKEKYRCKNLLRFLGRE